MSTDEEQRISHSGMVARSPEGHAARGMQIRGNEDVWIEIQAHTFRNWVNEKLLRTGHQVGNLAADMMDGVALVRLVQVLQKRSLKLLANPFNQHQCLANVSEALKAVEEDGVRLVNIGNVDIVNGNQKLILGLIWSLIVRYQIGQSKFPPKKLMLSWLKTALPGRHVDNFTTDWNSGVNLNALLDFCQPGLVPDWHRLNPEDGVENNRKAMKLAKVHFGIPIVLDPEYLSSPYIDELSGMTYLSYFMGIDSPGYRKALDWVRAQLPEETINNFTTDWNDGFLAAKLAVLYGAQIDVARDLDSRQHFWQNNWQTVIDACSLLGVEPPLMSAKDLSAPDVDYIGPMAYTSNFHWLPRRPPLSRQQPTFSKVQERQRSPSPPPLSPFPRPPPAPAAGASLTCPSRVGRVNRTYEFRVDGVRGEDVQVEVKGPGSILDTRQRTIGDAAHIEFEPQHMGMHQIEVRCGADPVANVPGLVRVLPEIGATPEQCGIEPCAVGSTVEVNINPNEVSDGTIRVTAFSPWHRPLNCPVSCSDQGVYSATFQPDQVGEWKIQITYNDQHISGSPFSCFVFDPNAVRVGELQGTRPGEPFTFLLDTRDAGWGRVQADIVWNGRSLVHQLRPLSDNVFRVTVTPPEYGRYRVYVYFNGLEMKDNPFKLRVDKSGYHSLTRRSSRVSNDRTSTPLTSQRMAISSIQRSWNTDTSTNHGESDRQHGVRSATDRNGDDYIVETTHYSSVKETKTTQRLEPLPSNSVVYTDSMGRRVGRTRSNIGSTRKSASLSNRASDRLHDRGDDNGRSITYEHANCGYCNGYSRHTSGKSRHSSSEKENISRSRRTHCSGDGWIAEQSRVMSPERLPSPSTLQRVPHRSGNHSKRVSDNISSTTHTRRSKTRSGEISDNRATNRMDPVSQEIYDGSFYDLNAAESSSKKFPDRDSRSHSVLDSSSPSKERSPGHYRTSFVTTIGPRRRSPIFVSKEESRFNGSASPSPDRATRLQQSESSRRTRVRYSRSPQPPPQTTTTTRYSSLSPERRVTGDGSQPVSHQQKRHSSAKGYDSGHWNQLEHDPSHSTLESSSHHSMRREVLKEHREYRVSQDSAKQVDISMNKLDLNGHHKDFSKLDLSPRLGTPPPDLLYDQDAHIKHIIRSARHDFDPASSDKIHVPKSGRQNVTSSGQNSVHFSPLPAKRHSKTNGRSADLSSESAAKSRVDKSVSLTENTSTSHSGKKTLHSTVVSQNFSGPDECERDTDEEDAESTVHVPICVPAKFAFQAPADVHLRHLDASIVGPSGKELDCDIETDGKEFVISYTPNEVGEHEIHVLVKESAVADSPFRVSVYDAANIAVEDISDAHIGQHVQIKIDGSRAGSGNLEISVNGGHVSSYVRDLGHHKFVASFVPHQAGEHTVDMTFNGHPVPGSPWVVNVTDRCPVKTDVMGSTGAVNVSIDHLRHFSSTNAASFDIHAAGRQITDISVDVIGPSKCSVGHKLSRDNSAPEGTYQCSFTAQEVGAYNIHVAIDKQQVSGSPFVCKCYNAGLINVSDIPTGVVGQACQFRVDASQAGEGQLEISINDGEVPNHVQVLGGGRCLVTFTPELPRAHTVQIKFNGRPVASSPFTCHVQSNSRVSLSLRHLELLAVGRPASFVIGVDGSGGSAELAVSVRGPAHTTLPVTVAGSVRAGFTAEFTPQQLGAHTVLVEYNGTPVSGTPFTSKVYDAGRVTVSDIPTADIGKTLQFTVDASEAGEGNLEIAIGAGGRNIPTQVHPQGAARFGVSFVPLEPVDHVINVSFNKQPIPGSPFTAYVQSDPNHIVVKGAALASTGVGKPSSFTLSNVTGNTTDVDVHIDGRHTTTKHH